MTVLVSVIKKKWEVHIMQRMDIINKLVNSGVVSVVRADSPEKAFKIVEAVVAGGIKSIELTYSVPKAKDVIAD